MTTTVPVPNQPRPRLRLLLLVSVGVGALGLFVCVYAREEPIQETRAPTPVAHLRDRQVITLYTPAESPQVSQPVVDAREELPFLGGWSFRAVFSGRDGYVCDSLLPPALSATPSKFTFGQLPSATGWTLDLNVEVPPRLANDRVTFIVPEGTRTARADVKGIGTVMMMADSDKMARCTIVEGAQAPVIDLAALSRQRAEVMDEAMAIEGVLLEDNPGLGPSIADEFPYGQEDEP